MRTKPLHISLTTFYSKVQSQLSETEAHKKQQKEKKQKQNSEYSGGW